ncbi:MAG: dTDP-glucose 4,6-dehydratase [Alphaproteobacteria bacterium]|nr:dTDP-glucose 4,6-dehydratase [Alphaproteobacteria bacterium]
MSGIGTVLVTGGAGFIGSAVIRHLVGDVGVRVINVDALTYAASPSSLAEVDASPLYSFKHADIRNREALADILERHRPDAIMHLAAESHVDRSIDGPDDFISTNITGTYTLLEAARGYWSGLGAGDRSRFRFHHISTDEVFGSLATGDPAFTEETPYAPRSPYAASKAASDHLVRAWHETWDLPVVLSNCSNNYGPNQFPEKLIPLMIIKGLAGEPFPVYGSGENVRDWLHVEDHARALWQILTRGRTGESYNVGGGSELRNIDVVTGICRLLDEFAPAADGASHLERIEFVTDRPGHDFRYAIDCAKLENELGWSPRESFESGLRRTVAWYIENRDWWQAILETRYAGGRLGTRG